MNSGRFNLKEALKYILTVLFALTTINAHAQNNKGEIYGKLVDSQSGEALIGANIFLENTTIGAASDLDGKYFIPAVPAGKYTVVFMMIGYAETKINDVVVKAGEKTKIEFALDPEILTTDVVVVEAKAVKNTDASLLKDRQKSSAISDAISAESFAKTGSGDAGDAMKMVTGASVVGGKYVYVRGLGDRYSSTHLNGAELPSADPDKKAFQMDLFPTNLLDNIKTLKTFTPDKPGNFSGGLVDIATKDFPDKFSLKISTSTSFNPNVSLNENFLSYQGGSTDWLGMDDGTREIPTELQDRSVSIPNYSQALVNPEKGALLNKYSKLFSSQMNPERTTAPVNQSYSLAIGNQVPLFGRKFGYLGSLTYGRKFSFYDDGEIGRWRLSGNINEVTGLTNDFAFSDQSGVDEVNIGGLLNMSYQLHQNHEIGTNFLISRSGESTSRYISGHYNDGNIDSDDVFETRVLKYTQRNLFSSQMHGKHYLPALFDSKLEWNTSYALSSQDEPDMRFFSDHYTILDDGSRLYTIKPSVYREPTRYFRDLSEDKISADMKYSIPFKQWYGMNSQFKTGFNISHKTREFRERIFKFENQDYLSYDGNPDSYFADSNMGIIDNSGSYPIFGNYVVDASEDRANYDGTETVSAFFIMVELPIASRFKIITGARVENTDINVETWDADYGSGTISETDVLPSVNMVYNLFENTNVRFAYGRTLARPTMRELAPFPSFDFAGGFFFSGNPDLERTLIDNFDIRYEYFSRPGEIMAVSGFYKKFQNPIERVILNDNGEIQFQNVNEAVVYGTEFEIRKKLDEVHTWLDQFSIGTNLSLIWSEVNIPEEEMIRIRALNPDAKSTRELQGQSPFLININLAYDNFASGSAASIYYNVFGERLSEVSIGGTPNIYEQPQHTLNFKFDQKLNNSIKMSFAAKNILNSPVNKVHHFNGEDYVYNKYSKGTDFSIGISYSIE